MAINLDSESANTIKVRRQSNHNQRRKLFMNSQMLQHEEDKVLKNYFFFQIQKMIYYVKYMTKVRFCV